MDHRVPPIHTPSPVSSQLYPQRWTHGRSSVNICPMQSLITHFLFGQFLSDPDTRTLYLSPE